MDILNAVWAIFSFFLNTAWAIVWFLLRDLLSTILWLGIAVWLILGARYRSFGAGSLAMMRYGRFGLKLFWRWLRGGPPPEPLSTRVQDKAQVQAGRRRVPFGYTSISAQLNMLLIGGIVALIFR